MVDISIVPVILWDTIEEDQSFLVQRSIGIRQQQYRAIDTALNININHIQHTYSAVSRGVNSPSSRWRNSTDTAGTMTWAYMDGFRVKMPLTVYTHDPNNSKRNKKPSPVGKRSNAVGQKVPKLIMAMPAWSNFCIYIDIYVFRRG